MSFSPRSKHKFITHYFLTSLRSPADKIAPCEGNTFLILPFRVFRMPRRISESGHRPVCAIAVLPSSFFNHPSPPASGTTPWHAKGTKSRKKKAVASTMPDTASNRIALENKFSLLSGSVCYRPRPAHLSSLRETATMTCRLKIGLCETTARPALFALYLMALCFAFYTVF